MNARDFVLTRLRKRPHEYEELLLEMGGGQEKRLIKTIRTLERQLVIWRDENNAWTLC